MKFGYHNSTAKSKSFYQSIMISYLSYSYMKNRKLDSNFVLKCQEELPETELPIQHMDTDDPEFEQLQHILNDPNIDPEMYREIMSETKNIGLQPIKFNQLHAQIKNDLEEDSWMGLRFLLNWRPTNLFTTETQLILDDKTKGFQKYRLSATTIVPGNGLFYMF